MLGCLLVLQDLVIFFLTRKFSIQSVYNNVFVLQLIWLMKILSFILVTPVKENDVPVSR